MKFNSIDEIITDLVAGKMIILMDDMQRENEGDVVIAAEKVTVEVINFIITHCKGLICVPMLKKNLDRLDLPLMVSEEENDESHCTQFTVSVDSLKTTSGISAEDRAETILALSKSNSRATDFRKPGHVFPLKCHPDRLAGRQGHTEGAIELMLLAGLNPVAVICEIIKKNGQMAREKDLFDFANQYQLKITSIELLAKYLRFEN